jgi:hypothetical protein
MLNQERWKEIESWDLCDGMGKLGSKELCIMQAVDYISSGGVSDHPECACPILTSVGIRLNDRFNKEHRQLLKPLIPLLVGTKSTDEIQIARKRLFHWRNVTVIFPLILDFIKLPEDAEKLRKYGNNVADMNSAAAFLKENRERIRKVADADASVYAYSYAYASADADADAFAYASADASAYAFASADALREKIAKAAIESFRLAIEIKRHS